jgi:hypothetical protein
MEVFALSSDIWLIAKYKGKVLYYLYDFDSSVSVAEWTKNQDEAIQFADEYQASKFKIKNIVNDKTTFLVNVKDKGEP